VSVQFRIATQRFPASVVFELPSHTQAEPVTLLFTIDSEVPDPFTPSNVMCLASMKRNTATELLITEALFPEAGLISRERVSLAEGFLRKVTGNVSPEA
jgi:hypothetical protein